MIQVTMTNNVGRQSVIAKSTDTIRDVFEANDFDYGTGALYINGAPVRPGDIDKTFEEIGITEVARISSVAKVDNAVNA